MTSPHRQMNPTDFDAAAAPTRRSWTRRLRALASGLVVALAGVTEALADQRVRDPSTAAQPDHSGSNAHDQHSQTSGPHGGKNHHHHHHGHGGQDGSSGHGGHDGGGAGGAGRNLFDSPLATKARRMAHQEQANAANANAGAGQGAAANHAAGTAQTGHLTVAVPASTGTVIPMPGGAPPIVIGPDGFLVNPSTGKATGNATGGAPTAPLS